MHPVHSTLSPTGCGLCALRSRRLFTSLLGIGAAGLLGVPAQAQQGAGQEEGLRGEVGRNSRFTSLVPAEQLEAAAAQQYQQMMREAAQQRALGKDCLLYTSRCV